MITNKKQSGAQKRKKKDNQIVALNKLPKITGYFNTKIENSQTPHVNINVEHSIIHTSEITNENSLNINTNCETEVKLTEANIEETTSKQNNVDWNKSLYKDPFFWPNDMQKSFVEYCLKNGPDFFQNINTGFINSKRSDKNFNRHLTLAMFTRTLPNGQICSRKWLLYSPSKGSVYCFVCKLFGSRRDNPFVSDGFDKWKKFERINEHENSQEHRNATNKWLLRSNNNNSINKELCRQIAAEIDYWFEVLKRLVSVITFLSSRGLAFRGKEDKLYCQNNGNYLGLLELISEYDPFLKAHIEKYGNQGKGNPSYLSKTICNELMTIMKTSLTSFIIDEIKKVKYFSIIMDSTPDLTKVDQMAIVLRYCTSTGVEERLLGLFSVKDHRGQTMYMILNEFLEKNGLDIMNIRGQSYDNASNMSGQFKGLQACVKNKNPLAVFIPCTAHSLNLVGVNSVSCCTEAINFFGFVQKLFNLFSGSTHRWKILIDIFKKKESNMKNSSRLFTLKSLSDTIWSYHAEACKAIVINYNHILGALKSIYDGEENNVTIIDAKSLWKKMVKRETGYMSLLWNDIMDRSDKTSTELQRPNCDTIKAINLLKSLKFYVLSLRDLNTFYEEKTTNLSSEISINYSDEEQRIKTKKFPDGKRSEQVLKGIDKFRVQTHMVIIDKFVSELSKRISAYEYIKDHFLFISNLTEKSNEKMDLSVSNFILKYKNDVDLSLKNELIQFREYWRLCQPSIDSTNILKLFDLFVNQSLEEVFPYIFTSLKIYLTIPVANCSAERAFSKLTRVKNKYRTTQTQESLNLQMILYSENDLLKSLDLNQMLRELASDKARKKKIV